MTNKRDIQDLIMGLNSVTNPIYSVTNPIFKYPIGNVQLTILVKNLEQAGIIYYNPTSQRWIKS